jgi:RimJ/RimL family protein N-acetyltransferase
MQNFQFETERLILRPTQLEDAAFIHRLMNTPKWLQYIGDRNVHDEEAAAKYIQERMLPQLDRLGFGNFTLIRKEDGEKIGTTGIYDRENLEGMDIGFALLPEYERQGYGYESASCLQNAAFNEFGLNKLSAITLPDNEASQQLLVKLNFELVEPIWLDGTQLLLYQMEV